MKFASYQPLSSRAKRGISVRKNRDPSPTSRMVAGLRLRMTGVESRQISLVSEAFLLKRHSCGSGNKCAFVVINYNHVFAPIMPNYIGIEWKAAFLVRVVNDASNVE